MAKNQNIKREQYCNKVNKAFKNGPHQKKILKKKLILYRLAHCPALVSSLVDIGQCAFFQKLFNFSNLKLSPG